MGAGEREEEMGRKGEGMSLFLGKGRENSFQREKETKSIDLSTLRIRM